MFSFHFDFALPLQNYKELVEIYKKSMIPYIWWGLNISRTNSILSFYISFKPLRDSYTNTLFYISLGILTFDFDFSITDVRNK